MRKITILMFMFIFTASLIAALNAKASSPGRVDDRYFKRMVTGRVVEALGRIDSPQTRDVLVKALKSKEFFIRANAAQALGRLQDKESITLLKPLINDKNYSVRILAAVALIDLGYRDAEKTLLAFLKNEDPAVRAVTVSQVGRLGENFLAALAEMLPKEKEEAVRIKLIEQLGSQRYKPALPLIRKALNDENAQVRSVACSAIANIGDRDSITGLIERLNDKNVFVRAAATGALGAFEERTQIDSFWKGTQEEAILQANSYVALANLGELKILPVLLEKIVAPESPTVIRTEAARALIILRPHISKLVKEALEEAEVLYDISLVESLQFDYQVEGRNLELIFTEALKDSKSPLHRDAPLILYNLNAKMALPALREALFQENPDTVATVAYVLGGFRDKQAAKYLIEVFKKYGI